MEWLQTIKEDLMKAQIVRFETDGKKYDYVVNPLSSGAPEIPTEALWGCAFEVAKVCEMRGIQKILTPEAMGIHVATALSMVTGIPMLVIRKKPYHLAGEIAVTKSTGYSTEKMFVNSVSPGDRVLLVDSIIATGGTYIAIIEALTKNKVTVQDAVAVIERVELGGVQKVREKTGVTVKTLIKLLLKDGKPVIT